MSVLEVCVKSFKGREGGERFPKVLEGRREWSGMFERKEGSSQRCESWRFVYKLRNGGRALESERGCGKFGSGLPKKRQSSQSCQFRKLI